MSSFIQLDIGVLMSSQSNDIFQEMVDLYPGADKMQKVINQYECGCDDPVTCSRRSFQLVLGQASQGDKEVAAKFIEEAAESCNTHEEMRDLMVKYHHRNCKHEIEIRPEDAIDNYPIKPEVYEFDTPEEAKEFLDSLFRGGSIH